MPLFQLLSAATQTARNFFNAMGQPDFFNAMGQPDCFNEESIVHCDTSVSTTGSVEGLIIVKSSFCNVPF